MDRCIYHESLATDKAQCRCKVHQQQHTRRLNTELERNNVGRNQSSCIEPLRATVTIRNGTFCETEHADSVNGRASSEKVELVFVGDWIQNLRIQVLFLFVEMFISWAISRQGIKIAGQFSVENFQKLSTALNRQWPLNFTGTLTKTNSKFFTISLTEIGRPMLLSLGRVSRRLLNSILDIEFTQLTVDVLVPLGLDLYYFFVRKFKNFNWFPFFKSLIVAGCTGFCHLGHEFDCSQSFRSKRWSCLVWVVSSQTGIQAQ